MTPKYLREIKDCHVVAAYDPNDIVKCNDPLVNTITVTYLPKFPAFLFPKGLRAYWKKDIIVQKFKGYLSEFKPIGMNEAGEPEATVTITPVVKETDGN